jgi:hypothetical protein
MKFFLDTEFNGFGGELISLALVPWETDHELPELYLATPSMSIEPEPWVLAHVLPIIDAPGAEPVWSVCENWPMLIADYLRNVSGYAPYIIADWPDDIRHFCNAIITGPGEMAPISRVQFDVLRVDAYPSTLPGAVQHNALWDARALRHHVRMRSI